METFTAKANEVQVWDTLPGLGNGYVFEVTENTEGYFKVETEYSRYNTAGSFGEDFVAIGFHDENGEENYLIVSGNTRLQVQR
jgi:hypothetical protein